MTRIALTALIPLWIFAWFAAGHFLLDWLTDDPRRSAWWSTPMWVAAALPGILIMVGGLVFVIILWVMELRP